MTKASPEIHDLARRLLALESGSDSSPEGRVDVAVQVIAELRVRLVKLAGIHGFQSLLLRALALTKLQVPSLACVRVGRDGAVDGFDEIDRSHDAGAAEHAGTLLVAHLLELLVTFIGAPLTLRLLRDKWPDASIDKAALRSEDKP